jgi:ankyrin repeat protein
MKTRNLRWILNTAALLTLLCGGALPAISQEQCELCGPALHGDVKATIALLNHNANVNAYDIDHFTPLMNAAIEDQGHVAILLLQNGADANIFPDGVDSPLSYAASNGDKQLVEALLEHGAHVDAANSKAVTPLMYAAEHPENYEILALLLEHHASVNLEDSDHGTAFEILLEAAAQKEKPTDEQRAALLKAAKLLLAYGADPNHGSMLNWLDDSGLLKDKRFVLALINAGTAPNTVIDRYSSGTLFSFAAAAPEPEFITRLLSKGADWKTIGTERPFNGNNAYLDFAAGCAQGPERIRLMAQLGVEFSWVSHYRGASAADYSSCWRNAENIRLLINLGVYFGGGGKAFNYSPILDATGNDDAASLQSLIDNGADYPDPDSAQYPSSADLLSSSLVMNHPEKVFSILVDYGADPDFNLQGVTFLNMFDNYFISLEKYDADPKDAAKVDEIYKKDRLILSEVINLRQESKGFLKFAGNQLAPILTKPLTELTAQQASTVKDLMLDGIEQYHRDPGSIGLRVFLMSIATHWLTQLPIPDEALRHEQAAQEAFKNAKTRTDYIDVAREYEAAVKIAPWVAAYTKNLCTVYELAGSYSRAKRNCAIYLGSEPADGAQIKLRIERLNDEIKQAETPRE